LNATTHAIFGAAVLAGYSYLSGTEPLVYAYPAAMVASWVPDVDNPRSRLGNGLSRIKNPLLNILTRHLSWLLQIVSNVLVRTVGHRTLTHSLLGCGVFALLASPLLGPYPELFVTLLCGYASHLLADALNTPGVPILWPVGFYFRVIPGGVRSGGVMEFAVAVVVGGGGSYLISLVHPAIGGLL